MENTNKTILEDLSDHHGLTWEPTSKMDPKEFLKKVNDAISILEELKFDEIHYHLHLLEKDNEEFETHEAIKESIENLELLKQEVEFCIDDKDWDYKNEN